MQQYFVKKQVNDTFSFYDQDIVHIKKVMRMKLQDEIVCVFNNKRYLCKLIKLEPLLAEIDKELVSNYCSNVSITLFQAMIKPKHFNDSVIKATEMNVETTYGVYFNRSQANLKINKDRTLKIIKESSEQSNRNNLMNFDIIKNLEKMLSYCEKLDLLIVAYENEDNLNLEHVLKMMDNKSKITVGIVIGPEGGFERDEINALKKQGAKIVKLTNTILRSETAAMYCIANITNKFN